MAAGALALTALAAGGCSAQQPGAAAVVEGETIEVSELHAATEELAPYLQDASPAAILVILIAEPTFDRIATENGVAVSTQQAQSLLDGLAAGGDGAGPAGATTEFSDASLAVARFTLLQQSLQALPDAESVLAGVTERLAELDVDVNPRYGDVDFAAGGLMPDDRPWLVADEA
ncbi:hypothetical protein [Cellulomonas sp. ATA003]|uniref:hypothetical protein n=1 Tax=Cellulomonas sp. ATA003 TaxID=3073064 RepID=UPI002873121F|nr:hypothetical protein [Cellulomonas sp. ATA003]WNB85067.1 hypothetical protein REH70_15555 [Cellulomonas sp. ATA003]